MASARWQYKHVVVELEYVEIGHTDLNRFEGAEGWEVYSAQIVDEHIHFFLKRPIES